MAKASTGGGRKNGAITGGAGGIGHCIIDQLIGRGYHIFVIDINESALLKTEAKYSSTSSVTTLQCDITSEEQVKATVSTVRSKLVDEKGLDLLVNNAGIINPGPYKTEAWTSVQKQLNVNLFGPMCVTHFFLEILKRPSSIINIISMAGILPLKDSAAYTAAKFGLRGFSASLALELADQGITVSGIFPTAVDTAMLRKEAKDGGSPLNFVSEPQTPQYIAQLAMKALDEGKMEYYGAPKMDHFFSRVAGGMWPSLISKILPKYEKKGLKGMVKFLSKVEAEEAASKNESSST